MPDLRVTAPMLAATALAVALAAAPPPGALRHDVERAAFLELGRAPQLRPVGAMSLVGDDQAARSSAVLIAPEWALTAAHTVDRPQRLERTRLAFGADTVRVAEVILHPAYVATSATTVDLALVRLDRPVRSVPPATLYRGAGEARQRIVIAGFGFALPGNTLAGDQTPPGTRHAGANVVDSVTAVQLLLDFDGPTLPALNRMGAAAADSLEYIPMGGDSGGGAFVREPDGWRLVGINGNVDVDFERVNAVGWYGTVVRLARVATSAAWIDSVTGGATVR